MKKKVNIANQESTPTPNAGKVNKRASGLRDIQRRAGNQAVNRGLQGKNQNHQASLFATKDPSNSRRLIFNQPVTYDDAVRYLWADRYSPQGGDLAIESEENLAQSGTDEKNRRSTRFLIDNENLEAMLALNGEVIRQYKVSMLPGLPPVSPTTKEEIEEWLPKELIPDDFRSDIAEYIISRSYSTPHIIRIPGKPPGGNVVIWVGYTDSVSQIRGYLTISVYQYLPEDEEFYQQKHGRGGFWDLYSKNTLKSRLDQSSAKFWNDYMAYFVEEQGIYPPLADRYVEQEARDQNIIFISGIISALSTAPGSYVKVPVRSSIRLPNLKKFPTSSRAPDVSPVSDLPKVKPIRSKRSTRVPQTGTPGNRRASVKSAELKKSRVSRIPKRKPAYDPSTQKGKEENRVGELLQEKANAGELRDVKQVIGQGEKPKDGRKGDWVLIDKKERRLDADLYQPTQSDPKAIQAQVYEKSGQAKVVVIELGKGASGEITKAQSKVLVEEILQTDGIGIQRVIVIKSNRILVDLSK